jgi:tetratricopeptide (TPR) repeat protein
MTEQQPLTIQQALNLAVQHHTAGDLPNAEGVYQQILQADPNQQVALHLLGVIAHQVGKNDIAVDLITKAITIKSDYAEAYSNLGLVLQGLERLDEAAASYNKAIAINPYYAEAHYNLGNTLQGLGTLDEAVASYKKAIAIKPDLVEAYYNLGITLQELGQLDKAVESYNKALAIKLDYAEAYSNLGIALQELGKLDEAVASYNKAINFKPDYVEAYSNIGNVFKILGRSDEALTSYNKALAINPNYAEARFNLGVFLYENRQYKGAAEQFKLTDFGKSKSYLLKCLYQLNDQSLFYDQLDNLISQGVINPVIGSLSSRSELRYGTDRPNPFCNDPLKYVLKTDLTEQCDFKNIFVKTAKDILNGNATSYKSQGHLTNGQQTAGNVLVQKTDFMDEINRIIIAEIEKYLLAFKDSEEGFIKNWPTNYSLYGWLICMKNGGELHPHMHDTWITGGIYINVPSKLNDDSGNLVVCIDDEEPLTEEYINPKRSIDVVTGSLCLFPASLLHYTIPFESEEERIVLAFDVVPK